MPSRLNNPLAKLRARSDKTNAALIRALQQAKKDIAGDIARIAAKKDIATSAKTREELYAEVAARFKTLSDGIDAQLKELIGDVAKDTHAQAVAEVEAKGAEVVIRYDPARTKRYFDLVRPGNGKNLAAVFTENMSAEAIRQLRTAFVDVFRQGAVQGMTANDMQKALQQQWNEKAGDTNAFRFRDRAGRAWDNASYLQMLVRTNAQRVAIDAYTDTLTESGFNLAKISEDGDPDCPVCAAWEGRIIQLSGKSKKFPTLEDARAAGMFHPNCTHRPEYVDELFDADEIARQGKSGKPTPGQMADRNTMQAQKDEIDRWRYTDKGLTPADADRAVTADRLERVIRAGTFSEEAAAAARSLPPEALDAIRKGGVPSFQTVKKGEVPGWRKGSAGGVVRVPRDATAKDVLDALGYEATKPEPPKQAETPKAPAAKSFKTAKEAQAAAAGLLPNDDSEYPRGPGGSTVSEYHSSKKDAGTYTGKADWGNMSPESAATIVRVLEKIQAENVRLGIPRLRGITVEKTGSASMGDGVLALNPEQFNHRFSDFNSARVDRSTAFQKTDPNYKFANVSDSFKEAQSIEATMWHEQGHHISQAYGVKGWGGYRNPPLMNELRSAWRSAGKGEGSYSHYAGKDYKEWFAENYALAKMGKTNEIDKSPELRAILTRLGVL